MKSISRPLVMDCLQELADKHVQTRLWLATGGEVSSFVEAVEQLFSDSGLDDALEKGAVFSPEIDQSLRKLAHLISTVETRQPRALLIESKQMEEVRECARAIWSALEAACVESTRSNRT